MSRRTAIVGRHRRQPAGVCRRGRPGRGRRDPAGRAHRPRRRGGARRDRLPRPPRGDRRAHPRLRGDPRRHALGARRRDNLGARVRGRRAGRATGLEAARRALADEMPEALIDLAFHAVIWEPQSYRKGDLRDVAALGVGSVKLWLAYHELGIQADDDVAFRVMQEAAELGIVVLAHCENGRVIDVLTRQLIEQGELGTESLPRSRPIGLEAECVHRFLVLAELAGATPYVVHVSGRASLDEIEVAAAAGNDRVRRGLSASPPVRRVGSLRARCRALRHDASAAHRRGPRGARGGPPRRRARHARLRPLSPAARREARDARRLQQDPHRAARASAPACRSGSRCPCRSSGWSRSPVPRRPGSSGWPGRARSRPAATPTSSSGIRPAPAQLSLESIDDALDWTPYGGIDVPGTFRYVLARGDRVVEDGRYVDTGHRGAYLPAARPAVVR